MKKKTTAFFFFPHSTDSRKDLDRPLYLHACHVSVRLLIWNPKQLYLRIWEVCRTYTIYSPLAGGVQGSCHKLSQGHNLPILADHYGAFWAFCSDLVFKSISEDRLSTVIKEESTTFRSLQIPGVQIYKKSRPYFLVFKSYLLYAILQDLDWINHWFDVPFANLHCVISAQNVSFWFK